MRTLLALTATVEPDRWRLARFTLSAVESLGGSPFSAAMVMVLLLSRLRSDAAQSDIPQEIRLQLDGNRLYLTWDRHAELVTMLPACPQEAVVEGLARRLRNASESTDPELLKRRNRQISADLEKAKQRAAAEMQQLQALLDKKKNELQESIRLAETDSLTGLFNRGAYDNQLSDAIFRCQRQAEPLCLILLDLDKFKEINDTFGHQHGDEYLKRMANAMRSAVREHVDHLYRIGGDEFAIVTFADMPVAYRVAEKVLNAMEQRVSIGVAQLREQDTLTSFPKRTDVALYKAKRGGRGRIVVAGSPEVLEDHRELSVGI